AAAPLILTRDMVSLSVQVARYEHQSAVASLRLYNGRNELIADIGFERGGERLFSAPIRVQDRLLGTADLRLDTPSRADLVRAAMANLGLSGLFHLLLLAGGFFLRRAGQGAPQPESATARERPQPPPRPDDIAATQDTAFTPPVPASYVHIALDDPNSLLQRVNVAMADELLTLLDQFVDRAARLYGGEVMTPFSVDGVNVRFAGSDGSERSLCALAAARLFLQLVVDASEERRAHGRLCLACKAGVLLSGEQQALTSVLAYTAPAGRILTTLPGADIELPCRLGPPYRLAIDSERALQVALVEHFAPEYEQLIHNQSQQILAREDDDIPVLEDSAPDLR
ncbi:MAG: hypothetical protein ACK4UT_09545, partial [Moraxellaceae bacterium]